MSWFNNKDQEARIKLLQTELLKEKDFSNRLINEKGKLQEVLSAMEDKIEGLNQQLHNATRRGAPVENVAIKTTGLVKVYDVLVGCDKGTGFYEDGVVDQRWLDVHKGQAGGYDLVLVKR